MIWPAFQDVELPLMNHFVGQGIDDLLFTIFTLLDDLVEQGQGKTNLALDRRAKTIPIQPWSRSSATHEHTD